MPSEKDQTAAADHVDKVDLGLSGLEILSEALQALCLRLFVVMGISWIFEIFHFLISDNQEDVGELEKHQLVVEIVMKMIGSLNLSRGIFLFFIFL